MHSDVVLLKSILGYSTTELKLQEKTNNDKTSFMLSVFTKWITVQKESLHIATLQMC